MGKRHGFFVRIGYDDNDSQTVWLEMEWADALLFPFILSGLFIAIALIGMLIQFHTGFIR